MTREKFPEKIPFRLTRMLTNAMEVNIPSLIRRELFLGKMAPISNVFFFPVLLLWLNLSTPAGRRDEVETVTYVFRSCDLYSTLQWEVTFSLMENRGNVFHFSVLP